MKKNKLFIFFILFIITVILPIGYLYTYKNKNLEKRRIKKIFFFLKDNLFKEREVYFNEEVFSSKFKIITTVVPILQDAAEAAVKECILRNKDTFGSIVVLSPNEGFNNLIAWATSQGMDIKEKFPAASLFKIATTVALLEKEITKSSLIKPREEIGEKELKVAFAKSINSRFQAWGKRLDNLREWGRKLGFSVDVVREGKEKEELAAGLNYSYISPLDAAKLACLIIEGGRSLPFNTISKIKWKNKEWEIKDFIKPEAKQIIPSNLANKLFPLLEATVKKPYGTAYSPLKKHTSRFYYLGGKTGSIWDEEGRYFSWFLSLYSIDGKRWYGASFFTSLPRNIWGYKATQLASNFFSLLLKRLEKF
jgi:membrane peptidoglycan carboxypeptidase